MNIELSNVLSVHANFLNIWNRTEKLDRIYNIAFDSQMCNNDRFKGVCDSIMVTSGEMRSTFDRWGRKMILFGMNAGEIIAVYERYVNGDEGFITCDLPVNLQYLGLPDRLTNMHLTDLVRMWEQNIIKRRNADTVPITTDGKFVWPEWYKHFFDDINGLLLKHDVDHATLIAEIIKYYSEWRIHHTEYFEESVIRVGTLSLFNGLEVTPIPMYLIPDGSFDIKDLTYGKAAIVPILDHNGFVLSILAVHEDIGFTASGIKYYYYGGFRHSA